MLSALLAFNLIALVSTGAFEVYLIDRKGHGKSSPFKEKISIKTVASDVEALIKYLKVKSINAIGYSYGGNVLFQLTLLQPGLSNHWFQ